MERQFTATVYILHENRALLHRHPKFGKWLPAGGHVEPNETPQEAAKREALEETGLNIGLYSQDNLLCRFDHAVSLERPFLILLEKIPQPPHQHIDLIYIGYPIDPNPQPLAPFEWFGREDLARLELFADTLSLLTLVFTKGVHALGLARLEEDRRVFLSPHMVEEQEVAPSPYTKG